MNGAGPSCPLLCPVQREGKGGGRLSLLRKEASTCFASGLLGELAAKQQSCIPAWFASLLSRGGIGLALALRGPWTGGLSSLQALPRAVWRLAGCKGVQEDLFVCETGCFLSIFSSASAVLRSIFSGSSAARLAGAKVMSGPVGVLADGDME